MAMSTGTADGEVMVEMNTTPLIDVMLVLLVMLIVTLPIQTHAVKLDMPNPNANPPPRLPVGNDITVDFDGRIYWTGQAVNMATLDGYFYNIGQNPIEEQPEIHITAN